MSISMSGVTLKREATSPTSSTPAASNIYSFTSFSNYLAYLFICLKEKNADLEE